MADKDDAPEPEAAEEVDNRPEEPVLPGSWAKDGKQSVKRWSDDGRSDDPNARVVHAPLEPGIGDGKAFFFLFGFRLSAASDRKMLEMELAHIDDDIEVLRRAGYTVVVDRQSTRQDFLDMIDRKAELAEGLAPAGFYWSAHGMADGKIQCCDGELIGTEDLDGKEIPDELRLAIMAACYVGSRSRTWKKAFQNKPMVVGWGRPVTIDKAVEFLQPDPETETDLDDLIRRFLLTDAPLPGDSTDRYSPAQEAAARGRIADLQDRIELLAEMLGAPWRKADNFLEIQVPLDGGRRQVARVFIIDSDQPFSEGEPVFGVESDVGELSQLVDPAMLLSGLPSQSYARVALVASETDQPTIVTQGFLPLSRVRDQDLAALIYQVADWGDELEKRIFGGDMR